MTVLLVIAVAVIGLGIIMYNSLVSLKNKVDNGWHQIETQLQRRYDLIPNLIETVKGYASHEKEVFENVTKQRAQVVSASTVAEKAQAENGVTSALKTLFAVAENYPELKANSNFQQLQGELSETEDKIAYARQFRILPNFR